MTGKAGCDGRGLWVNDRRTGTKIRVGNVGQELAYTFAEQGNAQLAREALKKPHFGIWFSQSF
jgi:hypothetical protein